MLGLGHVMDTFGMEFLTMALGAPMRREWIIESGWASTEMPTITMFEAIYGSSRESWHSYVNTPMFPEVKSPQMMSIQVGIDLRDSVSPAWTGRR